MTKSSKPKSWRDVLPIHPAALKMPPYNEAELRELGEDIKKNGLQSPIVLYQEKRNDGLHYSLLDGINRLDAMVLVGLDVALGRRDGWYALFVDGIEYEVRVVPEESSAVEFVISANIHRRHLTAEQRRDLIAEVLKATPEKSNRQIAEVLKVDHKTVAAVRAEKQATGEIPQLTKTIGKDGKARKPPTPPATAQKPTTDSVRSTPDQPPPAELIIAKCVEDVTNHLGKAVEHLDDIECVMLLERLQTIINMLLVEANKRAVESILSEEPTTAAERATEPETKPPSLAEPPPEMVECPKCHGTGNMDDDGIPEFLRRQSS